jgi:predicted phosphodiesterase
LPADLERILIISDLHSPFESKAAWKLVLDAAKDFQPEVFVSLGDFMDCFSVSHWSKSPERALSLREEVEHAAGLMDQIEAVTPGARRIWIDGNHENRLERYLQDKAPELFSLIGIPNLLRLEERGWEYVPYKQSIRIGRLNLTHDIGSAGRYVAYKALDTFQANVATGHTHRLGYAVEGDATGDSHVSHMLGWLGDVEQIDYAHRVRANREWALGFGYGYIDRRTGNVHLIPVPIVAGTAVVEGRFYDANAPKRIANKRRRAA